MMRLPSKITKLSLAIPRGISSLLTLLTLLTLPTLLTVGKVSAQRYRVLITEFMADPSPSVGLPGYEWVELYNASAVVVQLQGWRLADASGQSGPLPAFELQPDSFVLLGTASAAQAMAAYGQALTVTSWPSLDNAGDQLVLYDNNGLVVHELSYDDTWYGYPVKAAGGWTLEMIEPAHPCLGRTNWNASEDASGGTPGRAQQFSEWPPTPKLRLFSASPVSPTALLLRFSHAPDSQWMYQPANYALMDGPQVLQVAGADLSFNSVLLQLSGSLETERIYTIVVNNMSDCTGSPPRSDTVRTGLPVQPAAGDIVLNEILFHPPPAGKDFVEILHRGTQVIDAAGLQLASRNAAGQLQGWQPLASTADLLFPGDFRVYCTDTNWLRTSYPASPPSGMRLMTSMPSYPNTEGSVVLLTATGEILDEVSYSSSWHFPLLSSVEGVSLERISPDLPSREASTWHSAAASVGYGTPGYINSQAIGINRANGKFSLSSAHFSPNNDGIEDRLLILYQLPEPGAIASVQIFQAAGFPVRLLQRNVLLGRSGQFAWDGLDDLGRPVPTGIYIVWVEWFTLDGRRGIWKKAVVRR